MVTERGKRHWPLPPGRAQVRYGEEGDVGITFFALPERWTRRPEKLADRMGKVSAGYPAAGQLWLSGELRRLLKWQMPLPEMEWLQKIRREQPFCPHMVLILPDLGTEDGWRELEEEMAFLEEFLQEDYDGLNGLLLISRALEDCGCRNVSLEGIVPYFRRIYQETGLVAGCAGCLQDGALPRKPGPSSKGAGHPAPDGRRGYPSDGGRDTICIDMRKGYRIPFRGLPEGTLYLDMTSEPEKERLLRVKRRDVRYVSALNVLDTYVRNRYNTCWHKGEPWTGNGCI